MDNKSLVYIIEDEEAIVELYECAFDDAGLDMQCFNNATELEKALAKKTPNLFILDIMLTGKNGYAILESLKSDSKYRDIPVIMVSAKNDEISKVKALNMDADDYVSKPFSVIELLARVKLNLRKCSGAKKQDYIFKSITLSQSKREVLVAGQKLVLTKKEFNLLECLIKNSDQVVEREYLLKTVWGGDFFGETRTLDIHISELRKKIKTASNDIDIVTSRGVGYSLV